MWQKGTKIAESFAKKINPFEPCLTITMMQKPATTKLVVDRRIDVAN